MACLDSIVEVTEVTTKPWEGWLKSLGIASVGQGRRFDTQSDLNHLVGFCGASLKGCFLEFATTEELVQILPERFPASGTHRVLCKHSCHFTFLLPSPLSPEPDPGGSARNDEGSSW